MHESKYTLRKPVFPVLCRVVDIDGKSGGMPAEKGDRHMILTFLCNGLTRRLQKVENAVVAVRQDNSVDTIRIAMRQEEFNNIDLSEVSVKMLYVDEEGTTKAYQTGTDPVDGVYYADWELTSDVVDAEGNVTFAVKLAIVENGNVVKEWFSIPETFRVYDSLDDSNNPPGETESEQATNAERIAQLTSELGTTNSNLSALGASVDSIDTRVTNVESSKYELYGSKMTAIPSGADLNDYTTPGSYYSATSTITASLSHCPFTGAGFSLHVEVIAGTSDNQVMQTIKRRSTAGSTIYVRTASGGVFDVEEWEKVPTRSEMDTLTSNLGGVTFTEKFSVTSSGKTLTVPNNYRGVIYITDATVTNCGAYFIIASSNGSVRYRAITESAGLTISTATNAFTLTAGESASLSCIAMNISSKIQVAD